MRKLLVLFAITAGCGSPAEYPDAQPDSPRTPQPDASEPDAGVDARPDAAPDAAVIRGCSMGNMPLARTSTVDDSDPVPSGLVDELEDMVVGARHGLKTITIPPLIVSQRPAGSWEQDSSAAQQPCINHIANNSAFVGLYFPYDDQITITAMTIEVFGNGVNAGQVQLLRQNAIASGSTQIATLPALDAGPAAVGWTIYPFANPDHSPLTPFLVNGAHVYRMLGQFATAGVNSLGRMRITYYR